MNSSDSNPNLPVWIFIATDVALVATAAAIFATSAQPLSFDAMIAIVACVGLGAIVGLVPLIARYERQKNETLDDRQRALEALARTVSSSAEQISIATGGLNEIVEIAQRNVRHAEQLPHKLQEKIAEFQAQLATAVDADKEELERELLALRTTESERLESVSQRIAKSAAEWTKLEAASQQHLAAANEVLTRLGTSTAGAITKAHTEAARAVSESALAATKSIESAKLAALTALTAVLAEASAAVVERFSTNFTAKLSAATHDLDAKIARLEAAAAKAPAPDAPAPSSTETSDPAPVVAATSPDASAPPPRRPRKIRREEAAVVAAAGEGAANAGTAGDPVEPASPGHVAVEAVIPPVRLDEPPPIPIAAIPEIAPVVPATAEPFAGNVVTNGHVNSAPAASPEEGTEVASAGEAARPGRKRAARKSTTEEQPALELDDTAAGSAASVAEHVMSSDGATRLLVTAYIGIGNRLFIRGEGPGLTWEKGVPLQFVSIGKWRWETNDAAGPVQFKLYKNDELECSALGTQALEPGHQLEVTAAF